MLHNRFASLGLAVAAGLASSSAAMGASIGVNFVGGGGGAGNGAEDDRTLEPTDAAGVVAATNWNNAPGTTGTLAGLNSDAGATGASVTWAANGQWTAHDTPTGATPNQVLTNGYIDDTGTNADGVTTITFGGLQFQGTYDAYVYYGSDGNDRTGTITVGGTTFNIATNTNPFDNEFTAGTLEADGGADNGEYVLFTGLTGPDLVVTAARGSNNIGVHGVQLVGAVPEPSTFGLLGAAAVGLLARRRRNAAS